MPEISRHAVTAGTVSNMVEVVVQVMSMLGSEDVTNSLGGVIVTPEQVASMTTSELQSTYRDAAATRND